MTRWLYQSLRSRLLWLVLLALTPAIVLHVASALEKRRLARAAAEDNLWSLASLAAGQAQVVMDGAGDILRGLIRLPETSGPDLGKTDALLLQVPSLFPQFAQLARLDRGGTIVAASSPVLHGINLADHAWFRQALESTAPFLGGYDPEAAEARPGLVLAAPLSAAGRETAGVCVMVLRLDWFARIFAGIRFPDRAEACLVDEQARILATWPEHPERIGAKASEAKDLSLDASIADRLAWTTRRPDGGLYDYVSVPVIINGQPRLHLRLRQPIEAMLAPLDAAMYRDFSLLALGLALALAAAHLFARRFVLRPTARLVRMAEDMAGGDLTRRSGLADGHGEIADLARALDAMAATLQERIRFTQEIIDVVPTPLFYKDRDGRYLGCNRAYENELRPLSVIRGKPSRDFAPPEQASRCAAEDAHALDDPERTRIYECPVTFRDGSVRDVVIFKSVFRNASGAPAGIVAVLLDITARKRAEQALAASEGKYRALLTSMGDGYLALDDRGRLVESNPAFQDMLGYDAAELFGCTTRDITAWDGPGEPPAILDAIRTTPHGSRLFYKEYRRKDGTAIPVSLRLGLCPVEAGTDARYFAIVRDMTELVSHEQALRAAKEAAEEASRAKSDFLAKMSHEIRTPLNAIIGMTELTLATPLTPEQRDALETAREASKVLLAVISDILDISRIEARKLELVPEDFDVRRTVATMVRALRPQAGAKGLGLLLRLDPAVPRLLRGDQGRLRQILMNLLGNAIKFTRHGAVTLTVTPGPASDPSAVPLVFAVADTGIGIAPDKLEGIFDQFTQADVSATERHGGTGLGLAICRELARLMQGHVAVTSHPGQGSTFTATLAFAPARAETTPTPPASGPLADAPAPDRALRVLLAEDNPINVKVATTYLKRRGHRVTVAATGREALERLARDPFDLVFMDVEMPEIDGITATQRLRAGLAGEDNRRVPVFALTAHALSDARERCLAAGMDGYLAKPLDFKDLDAVLAHYSLTAPGQGADDPDAAQDAPVLDLPAALARLGGDTTLFAEIRDDFLRQYPGKLRAIGLCQETENWEEAAHIAHSLKNIAGAVGAEAARRLAGHLESHLRQADAQAVDRLLPELTHRLTQAHQALVTS